MGDTLRTRIGLAFARQRQALGLSQAEAAAQAGISASYLSDIERGTANPTIDLLEKLYNVLQWDPERLFPRTTRSFSEAVQREVAVWTDSLKVRLRELEGQLDGPRAESCSAPSGDAAASAEPR